MISRLNGLVGFVDHALSDIDLYLISLGWWWSGMDGVAQLSAGAFACPQRTFLVFLSSSLSNNMHSATLTCTRPRQY